MPAVIESWIINIEICNILHLKDCFKRVHVQVPTRKYRQPKALAKKNLRTWDQVAWDSPNQEKTHQQWIKRLGLYTSNMFFNCFPNALVKISRFHGVWPKLQDLLRKVWQNPNRSPPEVSHVASEKKSVPSSPKRTGSSSKHHFFKGNLLNFMSNHIFPIFRVMYRKVFRRTFIGFFP